MLGVTWLVSLLWLDPHLTKYTWQIVSHIQVGLHNDDNDLVTDSICSNETQFSQYGIWQNMMLQPIHIKNGNNEKGSYYLFGIGDWIRDKFIILIVIIKSWYEPIMNPRSRVHFLAYHTTTIMQIATKFSTHKMEESIGVSEFLWSIFCQGCVSDAVNFSLLVFTTSYWVADPLLTWLPVPYLQHLIRCLLYTKWYI